MKMKLPDKEVSQVLSYPPQQVEVFCWVVFFVLVAVVVFYEVLRAKKTEKEGEKGRGDIKKALLRNLVIVILFFALWEGAVRIYAGFYPKEKKFRHDTILWTLKPNTASVFDDVILSANSMGLRGDPVPEKEPGEFRILVLGDSWTIGQGVPGENTYAGQLEKILQQRRPGRKIRVINAGMFGYSVLQGYYMFKRLQPLYKPDMVIVGGFNVLADKEIAYYREYIDRARKVGPIRKLLNRLMLYQGVKKTISRFRKPDVDRKVGGETGRKLYEHYSGMLYKECLDLGIPVIVFDHMKRSAFVHDRLEAGGFPYEYGKTPEGHLYVRLPEDPSLNRGGNELPEPGKYGDKKLFFAVLAPRKGVSQKAMELPNDPTHPSQKAHRIMAELLAEIIRDRKHIK